MKDIVINGKIYPMWQQFVHKANEWKGGELVDFDMGMESRTIIEDIKLEANGDSAMFSIIGKDFTCSFGVKYGGVSPDSPLGKEYLGFSGYAGHRFYIKKP